MGRASNPRIPGATQAGLTVAITVFFQAESNRRAGRFRPPRAIHRNPILQALVLAEAGSSRTPKAFSGSHGFQDRYRRHIGLRFHVVGGEQGHRTLLQSCLQGRRPRQAVPFPEIGAPGLDSNRRPLPYKGSALPSELRERNLVRADGFEPPCLLEPGLQPGAFNRSAKHADIASIGSGDCLGRPPCAGVESNHAMPALQPPLCHFRVQRTIARSNGAGSETRTRGLNRGEVELYQLSYARLKSCAPSFEDGTSCGFPASIALHFDRRGRRNQSGPQQRCGRRAAIPIAGSAQGHVPRVAGPGPQASGCWYTVRDLNPRSSP